ncbi:MAG: TonB-dependent receptor [Candidatus Moduliflexus flocculans]|nr:TonB-dependent receptor [Candidatus Moduliflexus flocculans]
MTFNLGFRFDRMTTKYGEGKVYDYLTQPSDINDPNLGVLRTRAGTGNIFDFKTFSPRLGVTYQLTKDGKTVLRANYGRYYMPLAVEFLRRFGPDMQTTNLDYEIYWVPWDVADADGDGYIDCTGVSGFNELQGAVREIYGQTPLYVDERTQDRSWTLNVGENVKDMYTDQLSFNIEREIVKDFSLSATYIYKHSANIFVNVPINEVTGEEWEYERVPFDPEFGDPIDLYSIVWQDYTGDGKIDGADVVWIDDHGDYRVENMSSYSYTEDGDLDQAAADLPGPPAGLQQEVLRAVAGTGLGGLFLVERIGPAHHAPERQHDGPDDHRRHLDGHGQLHHQQHGRRPAVRAQMGDQGLGLVHPPRHRRRPRPPLPVPQGRPIWRLENYAVHSAVGLSRGLGHPRRRHGPHRLQHHAVLPAFAGPVRLPGREGHHRPEVRFVAHRARRLQRLQQLQRHQRRVRRTVGPDHGHQRRPEVPPQLHVPVLARHAQESARGPRPRAFYSSPDSGKSLSRALARGYPPGSPAPREPVRTVPPAAAGSPSSNGDLRG